jgi:hypothetical protein
MPPEACAGHEDHFIRLAEADALAEDRKVD